MIIHIDPKSEIPIYTQLTNQIIEGIARGKLETGGSLPSVRVLAADLGVNMHTVNKSYHQLEQKGIIQIVPKSGAIIQVQHESEQKLKERFKEDLKPLVAEALVVGLGNRQIKELIDTITNDIKGEQ